MFEKEAEEYTLKRLVNLEDFDSYQSAYDRFENGVQDAFKDGAEFGYNKVKEEMQEQIEKMKCCGNCSFSYCKTSSEHIDKDGNIIFHCWNIEKRTYCDVGKNGKYQCWQLRN